MVLKCKRWRFSVGLLSLFIPFFSAKADIPYVQGVNYLPQHYTGYYNDLKENMLISDDAIEKDFFVMSKNFNAIRTYQYDPINLQRILRAAKRYDMKVAVGIRIDPQNPQETNAQIDGLNRLFEEYPDLKSPVITIVLGNNVIHNQKRYFSKESTYLLEQLKRVSKFSWFQNSTIGLSVSESDKALMSNAGIHFLDQLSRLKLKSRVSLFVNIIPYMSGCNVEAAIGAQKNQVCKTNSFAERWTKLMSRREIRNYQVIIGETGWPTAGPGISKPITTQPGNLKDAITYYQFLYPYLSDKVVRGANISVPFFVFSAFDEPMNGVFGFPNNFWGVYNFDSTLKEGMVYPIDNRIVKPTPKLGTNIKVFLPTNSPYGKLPILFKTKNNIYSNIVPETAKDKLTIYSFLSDYPFVQYSLVDSDVDKEQSENIVSLVLPNGDDDKHKSATCTNELISGNGFGMQADMSLKWKYKQSKEPNCQYIKWAENGIWIN